MSFDHEWQVLSHMPTPVSADEFLLLTEATGVVDKLEPEKAMKPLIKIRVSMRIQKAERGMTATSEAVGSVIRGRRSYFFVML